jgi:hypothetical protein
MWDKNQALEQALKHLGPYERNAQRADELCANFGDGLRDQAAAAWA